LKTKISIKPVYFYEEDQQIVDAIDGGYINFQKLVKSLLWKWIKEQKGF